MHIAICDDQIADRKQLERLLGRESDARMGSTGNLYIDSFGSHEALMHAPMMYDLFFIDYASENLTGESIAKRLRAAGVTAPIALMSGKTDYKSFVTLPEGILHISKPILKKDLSDIISLGLDIAANKESSISIQGDFGTLYFAESNINYIQEGKHTIYIHTGDGRVETLPGKIEDVLHTFECNKKFFFIGKTIVNFTQVETVKFGKIIFKKGETLSVSPFHNAYYKSCYNVVNKLNS